MIKTAGRFVRRLALLTSVALGASVIPVGVAGAASAAAPVNRQLASPSALCGGMPDSDYGFNSPALDLLVQDLLQNACAAVGAGAQDLENEANIYAIVNREAALRAYYQCLETGGSYDVCVMHLTNTGG